MNNLIKQFFFAYELSLLHLKSSLEQKSTGLTTDILTFDLLHFLSNLSSQVIKISDVASANATWAASAIPSLRLHSCPALFLILLESQGSLTPYLPNKSNNHNLSRSSSIVSISLK